MVSSSSLGGVGPSDRSPAVGTGDGEGGLMGHNTTATFPHLDSAGELVVEDEEPLILIQDSFCDMDQLIRAQGGPGGKPTPRAGGGSGGGRGETVVCTLDCERGMLPVLSLRKNGREKEGQSNDLAITLNGGVVVPGPTYSLAPGARLKVEGLGGTSFVVKVRSNAGKQQQGLQRARSLTRDGSNERMEGGPLSTTKGGGELQPPTLGGGAGGGAKDRDISQPVVHTSTSAPGPLAVEGGGGASDLDSTLKALRGEQAKKDRPAPLFSFKSADNDSPGVSEDGVVGGSVGDSAAVAAEKKAEVSREKRHAARRAYVANRADFMQHFRKALRTPEEIDVSLHDFPYVTPPRVVIEQLKWIMTPYLQQHNAVLQRLQALPVGSFSQFIAITSPSGSVMHQERMLAALAKDLGASFLCVDGLPLIFHDDVVNEGDGRPSSVSTAFPLYTPTARSFKVDDRILYQGSNSQLKQRTGRVMSVPENGASSIAVRFDLPFSGGHTCGNMCDALHGYFVMGGDIVLQQDPNLQHKPGAMKDFSALAALREALMNVALGRPELPIQTDVPSPDTEQSPAVSSGGVEEAKRGEGGTQGQGHERLGEKSTPSATAVEGGAEAAPEEGDPMPAGGAKASEGSGSVVPPARPCIIFFSEMAELLAKAPTSTFSAMVSEIKAHVPIVVVAGFRSVKPPATPVKKTTLSLSSGTKMLGMGPNSSSASSYAVLDSVSAQGLDPQMVNNFFPTQLAMDKPADPAEAKQWDAMIEADGPQIRARRNVRRLRAGLHVTNAFVSEQTAAELLGHPLVQATSFRMDTLARLVLGACSFEAVATGTAQLPPPPTSTPPATAEAPAEPKKAKLPTGAPGMKAAPKLPAMEVTASSLDRALTLLLGEEPSEGTGERKRLVKPLSQHEEELRDSALITADQIGVSFDDVQLDETVKERLQELIVLPLRKPHLFKRGNLTSPTRGVLLFGPPGTGKTSLAKAVATEVGANFLCVNVSNMMSMWFGESEKYCRALFSLAVKLAPTIIFIDEVDALLGKRGGKEHEAMRKFKAEALAQWDGLTTSNAERVTVLGATNRPWDLDEAVLRRFSRRLYVKLPNAPMRDRILRVMLKDEQLSEDFDFPSISGDPVTQGFSGSDLRNVCIAAAYKPLRDYLVQERQSQAALAREADVVGAEGDELARSVAPTKAARLLEEQEARDSLRPLTSKDFLEAVREVGASVASDSPEAQELSTWNEMYGEKGSRRKSATAISAMYL